MMPAEMVSDVRVRVWAEIGRTRMRMSRAVAIQPGEIVELDADPDAPVDLYVNGRRLGKGTLVKVTESEWAVRIDSLAEGVAPAAAG